MEGGRIARNTVVAAGGVLVACAGLALYPQIGAIGVVVALSPATFLAIRGRLSNALELDSAVDEITAHDSALYWHGYRSAAYAGAIAREMGFRASHVRRIHTAALLHDIGKLAIEKRLLARPGPLTPEELAEIKRHSEIGASMVSQWDSTKKFATWIRHHHERMDGAGYPDGISRHEIPIESRIIAVADAYDAMVGAAGAGDSHPYRTKRGRADAIDEIWRCSGTQFDREVVVAFKSAMEVGEPDPTGLTAAPEC